MAGKRGGQVLAPILSDFKQVDKALETMENAAGSADKEMGIIRDSLEFKINEIKQTWVGVLQNITDRGGLGKLLDMLNNISEALGDIVSNAGLVKTALIAIGTVVGTKKLGLLSKDDSGSYSLFGKYKKNNTVDEDTQGFLNLFTSREFKGLSKDEFDSYKEMWTEDHGLASGVEEFFNAVKNGEHELSDSADLLDSFTKSAQNANEGVLGLKDGVKGFLKSIGSGALNIVKSFGVGLVNAFASYAISSIATNFISGIYNKISGKEEKELREKGNKKFTERTEQYKNEIKTIDDLEAKYTELNEKLKDNTLSTSELLSVKSDLRGLQDQMIEQYGAEANGIDLVTGAYDDQIEKLVELRKEQAQQYLYSNDKGVTTKKDKNGKTNLDRAFERVNSLYSGQDIFLSSNEGKSNINEYYGFDINSLLRKYKDINVQGDEYGDMHLVISPTIDKKALNDEIVGLTTELTKIQDNPKVKELLDGLGYVNIKFNSAKYEEALKNIQEAARAYMMIEADEKGKSLEDRAKEAVEAYNKAYEEYSKKSNPQNKDALEKAQQDLTNVKLDLSGFENKYRFDENFSQMIGVFSQMFSDIWDDQTKNGSQQIDAYFDKATGEVKSRYYEFTKDLSESEKLAFMDLLPEDAKAVTINELKDLIAEAKEIAEKNTIELDVRPKASAAVDSMANMKSAVESLSDLYNQTVLQSASENASNFATFAADPATLNSIESAFAKFSEELEKEGNDAAVNEINAALDNFERVSVESYGSDDYAEQMQDAIDQLITSYIDQTDAIKNLTEENKEWSIAQLKAMGITNAQDVVESRLTKTNKKLSKSYSKVSESIKVYKDALSRNDEETQQSSLEEIAKELNSVYKATDSKGNEIQLFDTEYVKENLAIITEAIETASDKYNDLDKLASKQYIAKIKEEVDDTDLRAKFTWLEDALMRFDDSQIEIGATMDDSEVVRALNNIYATGKYTFEEFSKMINTITGGKLKANIKWNTSAINSVMKYFKGNTVKGREFINSHMDEFMIPDEISYTYMGGGSGETAKYAPPASAGSSSGGGGGGGGSEPTQPKEEAEESFDWIEVAIQRIEEQITRLDKVVGNSYTLWGNRNKALADELDEITKKIEAEGIAQQEYLRNADKVQVNNGKGLNDDDYGENDELVKARDQELLDAAKKAWATGEYQRKVREGQMSGDDIEKIQNHFLADTIKEYQELYNKAVQAGDAVYDAMLERAGKYEERFNMVKDEYAELIQYVTDAADVIDEKINRTEKHGYFVSKSYYEQLKELEAQHGTYLQNEYNELVKKRDEAVSSGAIEEGSSAWNKMNQEINSVNLELEQHLTKMLEYNNTIRQLDWDFFDWVEERISRINDEASFLVDLMSNDKLYEDNGFLNNLGHATNAMYAAQYEVYMRQAKDYANERLKLEKEIAKDPANKDLIARYEELVDAQQDAIKGAEQMKDSVKSLVQEGINLYLQSLQKLIDKYKESLSDAKDLYSYQQNIAEQTKNIGNLRKQLTAYEGDDSEETRATVQRLRTQLEDAETKLKETEWDRYISETESFLSDMYTDMEETLNARLDDIDLLMHDMIDVANENSATVQDTIRTETDKVGYTLTSYFDGIVNGGSVLTTDLNNGFAQISGLMTNVLSVIEQIKNYAATMVDNGKTKVESTKTTTVNTNTPTAPKATGNTTTTTSNNNKPATNTTNNNSKPATNTTNNNKPARSETDYYGVALAIINGNYGWGNGDNRVSRLKQKGFDATKVQDLVNKIWNEGYIFSGAWVGRYQGITDLSKYSYNKYAKGSKRISHDQMAITQEKGAEMIFRNDDGSLLMPLGTGDKVFTAQMTDNLWELAKGKFTTNIPKTGGGNTINNSNAINITLPNVTNYEQFKTQLQNDPKMTSFIQQITLGEVSNGIKLNKRKY